MKSHGILWCRSSKYFLIIKTKQKLTHLKLNCTCPRTAVNIKQERQWRSVIHSILAVTIVIHYISGHYGDVCVTCCSQHNSPLSPPSSLFRAHTTERSLSTIASLATAGNRLLRHLHKSDGGVVCWRPPDGTADTKGIKFKTKLLFIYR